MLLALIVIESKMPSQSDSSKVAIVVPIYKKEFSPEEEVSFKHLVHFLGEYDNFFIAPENLQLNHENFRVKRFKDKNFNSLPTYNKLLLSRRFYETFADYKYILIYQLDCLVFSDQLLSWCDTGLDYIGAPWLADPDVPAKGFSRVGNGGFSLRKVESFLRVLSSPGRVIDPEVYWENFCVSRPTYARYLNYPRRYLKRLDVFNNVRWYSSRPSDNEDFFWSYVAEKLNPDFAVASVEQGLRFAFEVAPQFCFEKNNRQLPFGCHAWSKWDRNFWMPYLLK